MGPTTPRSQLQDRDRETGEGLQREPDTEVRPQPLPEGDSTPGSPREGRATPPSGVGAGRCAQSSQGRTGNRWSSKTRAALCPPGAGGVRALQPDHGGGAARLSGRQSRQGKPRREAELPGWRCGLSGLRAGEGMPCPVCNARQTSRERPGPCGPRGERLAGAEPTSQPWPGTRARHVSPEQKQVGSRGRHYWNVSNRGRPQRPGAE